MGRIAEMDEIYGFEPFQSTKPSVTKMQVSVGGGAQLIPAHTLHHEDCGRPWPQGIVYVGVLYVDR